MIPEHVPAPAADLLADTPADPGIQSVALGASAAGQATPPASPVSAPFTLVRDTFGRLILSRPGIPDTVVTPVRSFPISGPDEGISLVGPQTQELAWIDRLDTLPPNQQKLIVDELDQREFKPEILRIQRASTWATPSRWDIETDRGLAVLTLKSEDDIRRLSASTLLIADACGVHFLVRDLNALDRGSRRILDHFL